MDFDNIRALPWEAGHEKLRPFHTEDETRTPPSSVAVIFLLYSARMYSLVQILFLLPYV